MLTESDIKISVNEKTPKLHTVFMDGLNLLDTVFQFSRINFYILNCRIPHLMSKYVVDVTLENCTFGYWTFKHVQQVVLTNCTSTEDFSASLKFFNSSGSIENITIINLNFNRTSDGIILQNDSYIQITNSIFFNNTVNYGIVKVLYSSTLLMSDCIFQNNQAEEIASAIYAINSLMYVMNTYYKNNKAVHAGGVILLHSKSFIYITNSTFKNNQVAFEDPRKKMSNHGLGGAILVDKSTAMILHVNFTENTATVGGALYFKSESQLKAQYLYFHKNKAYLGSAVYGSLSSNFSCKNCLCYKNLLVLKIQMELLLK